MADEMVRKTYTFDEVYEWSTSLNRRRATRSGPSIKLLTIGSIIIILLVVLWLVFNSRKKKKPTEPEKEYVDVETGKPISATELSSGEYEVVSE